MLLQLSKLLLLSKQLLQLSKVLPKLLERQLLLLPRQGERLSKLLERQLSEAKLRKTGLLAQSGCVKRKLRLRQVLSARNPLPLLPPNRGAGQRLSGIRSWTGLLGNSLCDLSFFCRRGNSREGRNDLGRSVHLGRCQGLDWNHVEPLIADQDRLEN
jgi:hypothetical protein